MSESVVSVRELAKVVGSGLCLGCGFCTVPLTAPGEERAAVRMAWSERDEIHVPSVAPSQADVVEQRVCPGAAMDMRGLADQVFGAQPADPMLGQVIASWACHSTSPRTRRAAASGGFITELLAALLERGEIDLAYCASARKGPYESSGMIARTREALELAAGSHYHPVDFGAALGELSESGGRFAFVGLPCEVAALRQLMHHRQDIAERCRLVVGLFCGGVNRFDSGIGTYLRYNGIDPKQVSYIDYRHGTWPGMISLRTKAGETRELPRIRGNTRMGIIRYMVAFQGYGMLLRCRICPDQVSDFADISVGDPHIERFKAAASDGWSAVLVRTPRGEQAFAALIKEQRIVAEPLTLEEVARSQGYTLENRRHAMLYRRMARRLGMAAPSLTVYEGLEQPRSWHQHVYAWVDLMKIRHRGNRWLQRIYVPLQIFEYLFLTFSPRIFLQRLKKVTSNR